MKYSSLKYLTLSNATLRKSMHAPGITSTLIGAMLSENSGAIFHKGHSGHRNRKYSASIAWLRIVGYVWIELSCTDKSVFNNRSEEHTSELQSHSFISYAL